MAQLIRALSFPHQHSLDDPRVDTRGVTRAVRIPFVVSSFGKFFLPLDNSFVQVVRRAEGSRVKGQAARARPLVASICEFNFNFIPELQRSNSNSTSFFTPPRALAQIDSKFVISFLRFFFSFSLHVLHVCTYYQYYTVLSNYNMLLNATVLAGAFTQSGPR